MQRDCLSEAGKKLDDAARIARTAEACAQAGGIDEGVRISMDAEQLIYGAGRLDEAASLTAFRKKDRPAICAQKQGTGACLPIIGNGKAYG